MNDCKFLGRFTRDPELKSSGSGVEFVNFTLAVDRKVKKGAEKKADFVDFTAFNQTAALICKFFHKGDPLIVHGRLESTKFKDKEGNDRTRWGITVNEVEFVPKGKSSSANIDAQSGLEVANTEDLPF